MEAAEALGRGNLSTLYEAARGAVRARSGAFWMVARVAPLPAGLRSAARWCFWLVKPDAGRA